MYHSHRFVGLVVRRPARQRQTWVRFPISPWIFFFFFFWGGGGGGGSKSSHTSDLKIGTPVTTLPAAWRSRVSAGTGRPGVSIPRLGETASLICSFCLSETAPTIV